MPPALFALVVLGSFGGRVSLFAQAGPDCDPLDFSLSHGWDGRHVPLYLAID
jgi:hypothetical protein